MFNAAIIWQHDAIECSLSNPMEDTMTTLLAILTENFADWELGPLAAAARGYCDIEVVTAAPEGRPVTSMGGLRVMPDMAIDEIALSEIDALIVIGGSVWDVPEAPNLSALLNDAHRQGKLIGAICGGTRPLAASSLLDSIPHTSNDSSYLADVEGYNGQSHFVASAATLKCGRIVTASGIAPISFMRTVITALGHGGDALDYYAGMFGAEFEGRHRMAA
jgi:putative intracellular protease/amidase